METNSVRKYGKKFALSIFVVLYAFIAFVQVTYAWIGLSNTNSWETQEFGVLSESNLYLSLDGKTFHNTISGSELQKVIGSKAQVQDVTTTNGRIFYRAYNLESIAVANRSYVSFQLWFRTDDLSLKNLFLVDNITPSLNHVEGKYDNILRDNQDGKKLNGTYVVSQGVEWVSDITFSNGEKDIEEGSIGTYYAADAIRIAVVEEELDEFFGIEKKNNLLSMIFDPSENESRGYGVPYGALDYYSKRKKMDLIPPIDSLNTIYSLSTFKNPYQAVDDNSMVASFQKVVDENSKTWFYTKVTVNIWIEGWDADCFDAIRRDKLVLQLKFKAANLA